MRFRDSGFIEGLLFVIAINVSVLLFIIGISLIISLVN